jgi:hypothetical protein
MTVKSAPTNNGQNTTPSNQPLWLPPGASFSVLPKATQETIVQILNPAYRKLVLEASDALEQAEGLSYCSLLFFQIVATQALGEQAIAGYLTQLTVSKSLAALMGVTGQKARIASFLLGLQKFRDKLERASTAPVEAKP